MIRRILPAIAVLALAVSVSLSEHAGDTSAAKDYVANSAAW
jgi:hypothetical protein